MRKRKKYTEKEIAESQERHMKAHHFKRGNFFHIKKRRPISSNIGMALDW